MKPSSCFLDDTGMVGGEVSLLEEVHVVDNGFVSLAEMEFEHRPILDGIASEMIYLQGCEAAVRRILDLGCGNGALLRKLARKYNRLGYWGIDLDPDKVERGSTILSMKKVFLRQGNICWMAQESKVSGTFGLVIVNVAFLLFPGSLLLQCWLAEHAKLVYAYSYSEDEPRTMHAIEFAAEQGVDLDLLSSSCDRGTKLWRARWHGLKA